ncbi:MAG: hydrogenase nickel incorporation protein HypB [Desulfotomaculales bacterium]
MQVILARDLLSANAGLAVENRRMCDGRRVAVVNLIGSPGAGKTTLLEKTLCMLKGGLRAGVIEGDVATARDAKRIAALGVPVVQINTGGLCHLDARMVSRALAELPLAGLDLLFIENVGNLVCPASFDLGEHRKAVVLSVAEGSDKPAKYPAVFREAQAVVVSKTDLLPHTDFDLRDCLAGLREAGGEPSFFALSAKTGEGLAAWVEWLEKLVAEKKGSGAGVPGRTG